jgi:hypothetical protein
MAGSSANGPSRSRSHPGNWRSSPGKASGMQLSTLINPALPLEVPLPGGCGSKSVVETPARRSTSATQAPMMPAPTTATVGCGVGAEDEGV